MKFKCVNEMEQLSFDDSEVLEFKIENKRMLFSFNGATIKAKNSQNGRFQDMYCGEIVLQLENAEIARLVKEGMKYYDADGNLQSEIPDEDVPAGVAVNEAVDIAKRFGTDRSPAFVNGVLGSIVRDCAEE